MVSTKRPNMNFTFHILCALAAFSMIVYCSYRFLLNEDVTEIGYKPMKDNYPDLTLCFYPPFLEHKLKAYGEDLETWQYGLFLTGHYWDERMLSIDYENVTIDWREYFLDSCVYSSHNNDGCQKITDVRSFSFMNYKCFSILPDTNKKTISNLELRIKTSIFSNGIRPQSGGFRVHLHYRSQFLRSWSTGNF